MKPRNFCGLIVGLGVFVCAAVTLSIAGSPSGGPAAPTLEGGPTYVNGRPSANLQGTPLPAPQTATGSLFSSGTNPAPGSGAQTGAPGAGSNSSGIAPGSGERGVAGSGLPREKVSVVDTKTLPASKTDRRFDTSLMDLGLKSAGDAKSTSATQREVSKSQTATGKFTSSSKASEQNKAQAASSTSAAAESSKKKDN